VDYTTCEKSEPAPEKEKRGTPHLWIRKINQGFWKRGWKERRLSGSPKEGQSIVEKHVVNG